MASDVFARLSRDRVDRLLEFRVAVAALVGLVVFGAAAGCEFTARAWMIGMLCGLPAMVCALVVALNILVEAAGYAVTWLRVLGTVLALPLLMVPAVRRWVARIWLPGNEIHPEPQPRAQTPLPRRVAVAPGGRANAGHGGYPGPAAWQGYPMPVPPRRPPRW